jgi:hypothetical protein
VPTQQRFFLAQQVLQRSGVEGGNFIYIELIGHFLQKI